jgi:hypothetical protein
MFRAKFIGIFMLYLHTEFHMLNSSGSLLTINVSEAFQRKKNTAAPFWQAMGAYWGETSRIPHILNNRQTDGGEVVSLACWLRSTSQDNSWYSFLLGAK